MWRHEIAISRSLGDAPVASYMRERQCEASAADLKFLQRLRQIRLGTSNRKAALEIRELLVPLCFRSSCQRVLRDITNFGNGALGQRFLDSNHIRRLRRAYRTKY